MHSYHPKHLLPPPQDLSGTSEFKPMDDVEVEWGEPPAAAAATDAEGQQQGEQQQQQQQPARRLSRSNNRNGSNCSEQF